MSETQAVVLMNSEEFFALPDAPEVRQRLVRGELKEDAVTKRNPHHSGATAALSRLIGNWVAEQPEPRGWVYDGEAYFRIRRNPDTNVGIVVAYASAELVAATGPKDKFLDGPPVLAVEVLSPNDTIEEISETVEDYLDAGVRLVWIVNPFDREVKVHRQDVAAEYVNEMGVLNGDPEMPGLRIRVADLFPRRTNS